MIEYYREMADDDGECFETDSHSKGVMEQIKLMYQNRELTDVCITVNGHQFHCHRAVLAASSPYFHAMFTAGLAESRQSDVTLHEVDVESVKSLIDHAYTGRVWLTPFNVQSLRSAASLFQVCLFI